VEAGGAGEGCPSGNYNVNQARYPERYARAEVQQDKHTQDNGNPGNDGGGNSSVPSPPQAARGSAPTPPPHFRYALRCYGGNRFP
jgi:hypothetical protein